MKPLSAIEIRVVGALMEKEVTTPDQYPLSLNGLTTACNQKSNREPVMALTELEVQDAIDTLSKKGHVKPLEGFGSRVQKYHQRFCNSEFGELKFTAQEYGIICVLFLRGPQTPGELRSRTQRLCQFSDVSEVEKTLHALRQRSTPLVQVLPKEPGKREARYKHLFAEDGEDSTESSCHSATVDQAATSNEMIDREVVNQIDSSEDVSIAAESIARIEVLEQQLTAALDRILTLELELEQLKKSLPSDKSNEA